MASVALKEKRLANIFENGLLLLQDNTPTGVTVSLGRTELGGIVEPFSKKNGIGPNLTTVLRRAVLGHTGIKVVQSKIGRKEVTVEVTGL
jgi:hypothetical protein